MKHSKMSKVIAIVLCVMMLLSVVPMTAFASIANWDTENVVFDGTSFGTNGYYNVISKKDYVLVPGAATETEMVINNSTGTRRQVMHIIELDPSNPDVSILPGYYGIDKFAADPTNTAYHKAAGVTNVAEYYDTTLGYQVVGAMNTCLAYDCNAPYSWLVYNGEVLVDHKNGINDFHTGGCQTMLCVYKDADSGVCSVELREAAQGLRGDEWQAIGANFAMTVKDGELVNKSENHNGGSDDAARSMIGVKEDGTLVLVMNDGRGSNNSKGFCSYELGESMLALGCKWAFNCDGGGSSSFVTRRVGEEDLVCRCVPCDGAERPTIGSVIVVSNVAPTGELDTINIESDYDIFAPNTTYTFEAKAIDTHGYAMDMPADAAWALADSSFGTIENGTFVSNGKLGKVTVQVISNATVFGEKEIEIANPTTLKFAQAATVIPYGRSITLDIVSMIGEADVYLDGNSFDFAISTPAAGVLEGLVFTATTDESVAGTKITATYKATSTNIEFNIELGKGSEIIWDFEDGDLHGFLGQQDAYDWQKEHGVEKPFDVASNSLIVSGQISTDVSSTAFISSVENGGQVHNGQYALGYRFNMTQDAFNQWTYAVIYNVSNINGDVVLRDVANGKKATALGCWVYVPYGFYTAENSGALALQANLFGGATKETAKQIGLNMQYNGKNLNSLTENDIPENRWVYVTADLTGSNYVSLVDPLQTDFRSPSVMRMYVKPSVAQILTYYFDEFTLDYSSAVDDRVPPTISNPQYATADTNIAFDDGVVITDVSAAYTATISDNNSGIDPTTAAIYIDGNKVESTKVVGSTMFCDNVALGVGTHKVKFEIADKLGNYTTLTRTIVSETEDHHMYYRTRIELSGHNDSGETPMPGSLYYIDVTSNYSDAGVTADFTLALSTANTWELDHMIKGAGVEVSYTVNPCMPNEVTFSMTSPTAKGTLLSIPVRVYNPLLTNGTSDGSPVVVSGVSFKAPLSVEMTSCKVFESYGNYEKFSVAALDAVHKIERHEHTAHAVEDKAASCTEAGYTGRTYCDVCQSIVDWGTEVATTGHAYELVGDKFICDDCGDEFDYSGITGVFEAGGKYYYAIAGKLVSGWQQVEDDWYYFSPATHSNVPTCSNGFVTFTFDETGKLTHGEWYNDGVGTRYYYCGTDYYKCVAGNSYANANWVEIDGQTYCFDRHGYRHEGIRVIISSNNPTVLCEFSENGVYIGEYDTDYTGLFQCNGYKCYLENGTPVQTGLIRVGNDFYYINSTYTALANGSYTLTNMGHYGISAGTYEFDAEGRMLNVPLFTGIDENDFAYINGVKQTACKVVNIKGDFYYVYTSNKIAKDCMFFFSSSRLEGTGLEEGYYQIDSEGKMSRFTGIYNDYAYVDGTQQFACKVVELDGDFYYVYTSNKIAKDCMFFFSSSRLEGTGLEEGYYQIDSEGKMSRFTGIYNDYAYVDGVQQLAGKVVEINGDFYYVYIGNKIAKDMILRFTDKFLVDVPLTAGKYTINENGKLIVPPLDEDGIITFNGSLYYVKDGVLQNDMGIVIINDEYYYIKEDATLGVGTFRVSKGNNYIKAGNYTFDDTGKMIDHYNLIGVYSGRDIAFLNQTSSDVKIKAGMLYRGTELDGAMRSDLTEDYKEYAVYSVQKTGVKSEIDLRGEIPGLTKDMLGESVLHKYYNMVFYEDVFTDEGKAVVKAIFEDLANPENYPIYLHCTQGIDRTGTVCYLLEALLGFDDWNLIHDYCTIIGSTESLIQRIATGLNNFSGDTRKEQVTNYLLSCGLTQNQLDTICELFLAD